MTCITFEIIHPAVEQSLAAMIVHIGADLHVYIIVGAGAVPHLDLHLLDGLVVVLLTMTNNTITRAQSTKTTPTFTLHLLVCLE